MKRKSDAGRAVKQPVVSSASTPSVPLPPPELLERAKKLGAISAGPAMFGMGAEMAAATPAVAPRLGEKTTEKPKARKAKR